MHHATIAALASVWIYSTTPLLLERMDFARVCSKTTLISTGVIGNNRIILVGCTYIACSMRTSRWCGSLRKSWSLQWATTAILELQSHWITMRLLSALMASLAMINKELLLCTNAIKSKRTGRATGIIIPSTNSRNRGANCNRIYPLPIVQPMPWCQATLI